MAGGRPTEYSQDILDKAQEYLENLPETEKVHSLEGLAEYLGITRPTIYDWESQEDKKGFSYIVNRIRQVQAKTLINNGLDNKFNPSITKLMLTKHGYTDKQEVDVTTQGEKINNTDEIKELTQKLNEVYKQ